MSLTINRSTAKGNIKIASSKSYAHRYLVVACFAKTKSIIRNVNYCDDVLVTIDCLKKIGVQIEIDGNDVIIEPLNYGVINYSHIYEFDCHNSASTLRMLIPICLGLGLKSIIHVSKKLYERGISGYKQLFVENKVVAKNDEYYFYIEGKIDNSILNVIGEESSQFVTGAILSAVVIKKDIVVKTANLVSKAYVDLTIDVLNKFQLEVVKLNDDIFAVKYHEYNGIDVLLEPDYSLACVMSSFNYFGGDVKITNLETKSLQADFKYFDAINQIQNGNAIIDVDQFIDLAPTLFVCASKINTTKFINFNRLKFKESNRLFAMIELFNKFNIKYSLNDNELIIYQSEYMKPIGVIDTYHDHRIAMAAVLLLAITGGTIDDEQCIAKSYPNFLDDLKNIQIDFMVN